MKKLKVGIIGLGMGASHINGFRTHPDVEVVAVADTDPARLEQKGKNEFKIPNCYLSAEEMLKKENLDIVSVVTPNKFHMPLTLAALNAGCHVLCEKPMAMNAKEAEKMLSAAKKAKKKLMINFSFRFTPQSYAMKKEVESGTIGDVYFARSVWQRRRGMPGFGGWFSTKALSGGGPLIDVGVHRLDLALWLMNYPKPKWVMAGAHNHIASRIAKEQNKKYDVEDFATAFIRFENGATLELEASWAGNIKENEMMETRLLGTNGGLLQKNLNGGYEFEAEFFIERNGCQYDMKLHPPVPAAHCSMYHFADAVINNKDHIATGEEGLIVMRLLDAIYESAKTGNPVKIK